MQRPLARSIGCVLLVAAMGLLMQAFGARQIASTGFRYALYGSEQRKIARDSRGSLYVVYETAVSRQGPYSICFVRTADSTRSIWTVADTLGHGTSPTIAIGRDDCVHVMYRAGGQAVYMQRAVGGQWTEPRYVNAGGAPSIDVDSSGLAHMAWVESGEIRYCRASDDSISAVDTLLRAGRNYYGALSATIAGDLGYSTDKMYIAHSYEYRQGPFLQRATGMLRGSSSGEEWCCLVGDIGTLSTCGDHVERVDGGKPVLAVAYPVHGADEAPVMLYESGGSLRCMLIYTYRPHGSRIDTFTLGPVQNGEYGIDNPVLWHGVQFSYVANRGDSVVHGYVDWGFGSGRDAYLRTSINNVIRNERRPFSPSITYKQFNRDSVDVIWMEHVVEGADTTYAIMHERMPKGLMTRVAQMKRPSARHVRANENVQVAFDLMGRRRNSSGRGVTILQAPHGTQPVLFVRP